jgi:adenylosuccinate lyase
MDRFDCVSPLDYRYYGGNQRLFKRISPILSERAAIRYCLMVEAAVVRALENRFLCPPGTADEVEAAITEVTPEDVEREDAVIHHYTKAIVNALRDKVSDRAKPFVHLFVTSFDIQDTSFCLRLRDVVTKVIVPDLRQLEATLIKVARAGADIVQIGRTHGQHAVPITFGFAIAEYVDRLGQRILFINDAVDNLRGVISGAVGAYNAMTLAIPDPENFEEEVLHLLGLRPGRYSTQIVEPEYVTDMTYAVVSTFGVLANFADDIRHLQRTEIQEVAEGFSEQQVGSSTMPHKRNPWNLEHVKSLWKEFTPRLFSVLQNQISEHQRDLTNSASGRFVPEIYVAFTDAVDRLLRVCSTLEIHPQNMAKNVAMSADHSAEQLYILLSLQGLADAHTLAQRLSVQAREQGRSVFECALADPALASYVAKLTPAQKESVNDPTQYTGVSVRKTHEVCDYWEATLLLES